MRISSTCAFDFSDGGGLDGPLSFTGVFSVDVDSGAFYLTVGSSSHAGSLVDSSFKIVEEPAFRDLGCESMGNEVDETITGEFFDAAQAQRWGTAANRPTEAAPRMAGLRMQALQMEGRQTRALQMVALKMAARPRVLTMVDRRRRCSSVGN